MMNRIIDYIVALGDLFMPRSCLACGCRLGMRERHLCLSCAADVPYTRFWLAPHNPLADRFNALLERHRGTGPMDYAYAAALIYYKGAYRAIPRALKYQGDLAAGRHYGALLGRRLAAAPHFADVDLILPVPLHWTRRWTRGYNQAEILARALSDAFRVSSAQSDAFRVASSQAQSKSDTIRAASAQAQSDALRVAPSPPEVRTDLLVRVRRTRTQTRLSVEEKAQNVTSAFQVPDRFPLWARIVSRLARHLSRFARRFTRSTQVASRGVRVFPSRLARVLSSRSARGPFGSGSDENNTSTPPLFSPVSTSGRPFESGSDGKNTSTPPLFSPVSTSGRPFGSGLGSNDLRDTPAGILASARHILLVDDTFTTGATLYACYAALRPFTNARISIATLAAVEGTPSGIAGPVSSGGRPSVPSGSTPSVPIGSTPSVPSGSRPSVPIDNTPSVPSGSTPSVPIDSTPSSPPGGRPSVPIGGASSALAGSP